ncbi:GWxTD domain-containing protein, partial [bacterium]|nr:GWxTD domain-containing protein [bacterium]
KLDKSILSTMGLEIGIKLIQSKKESEVIKKISIYKPGLSGFVNNVENSFQQMRYILTNNERKEAKGKKGKALEKIFLDFWNKRDPTPETNINELMEEYYIRVNYVNEYFNMSWKEGWETDFGMIYILFGPPDEIQRSNSTSTNTSIYQAWYYNRLNKQFVFRDQNGFGDFKLDKPFIGPNF